jgi:glycosyltransferase involved in cell wall biosynthesis
MTMPRVSVVLPSYNHGKYVGACVDAFLRQSFQDFELIIIDDASSDDNVEQIGRFQDSRIRLLSRQANRGVAAGMNDGFRMAKADIVCFFASDDLPEPGYLEAVLRAFDANPAAVGVYFPLRKIGESGESLGEQVRLPSGAGRRELLRRSFMGGNQLPSPGMAVRRSAVVEAFLPEGVSQYSDWMLNNRLLMRGEVVLFDAPMVAYRVAAGSLSGRSDAAIGREAAETRLMMDDFLNLRTIDQLRDVFGKDMEEFAGLPDAHVPYVLGRLALRSDYHEKRCWGYETIMRHLSAPGVAESLAACAGFTYKDFMAAVPRPQGSPVKEINDLRRRLRRQRIISFILGVGLAVAVVLWLASR